MPRKPPLLIGEKHPLWKGEDVSYDSLHKWVARHKGTPKFCEGCGREDKKRYEWANVSGKYFRDLDDFMRLCKKCHFEYDGRIFPPNLPRPEGWVDPKKQLNFKRCWQCPKKVRVVKARWKTFKYCSKECKYKAQKGKQLLNVDNRGKPSWNAGKTNVYSEETKKAMGAKNVGINRSFKTQFGQPKGWKRS